MENLEIIQRYKTFKLSAQFFFINDQFAKAPSLNLGKDLSNLLSNHEALNQ